MFTIKKGKFSQPRHREAQELEQAFYEVTEASNPQFTYPADSYDDAGADTPYERPTRSHKGLVALIAVVAVVLLAVAGGTWWFMDYTADDGMIYSNVRAAGVEIGGMTPEQAKAAVLSAVESTYSQQNLTINLPDTQLVLTPADTKVQVDVDALVDAAYGYGRGGNRWENALARKDALNTLFTLDAADYMSLDQEQIRLVLDTAAQNAASELSQPIVTVTGETPALDRTLAEAQSDESVVHKTMTITLGTPQRSLDTEALFNAVLDAYSNNDFTALQAEYQVVEPDPIDLQALHTQHCVAPVDAVLNEETYVVTPEILGYGFDLEQAQAQLDAAQNGDEIQLTFDFIDAEVTLLSLDEYMFKDDLGSYASVHTNIPARTNNLVLACKAIDGTIVRPGEVFSFNKVVGERTAAKGYKAAIVYTAGKSEPQLGGGICQVASTMYYCTLMADLEIVERGPHQFMVDYVPKGMDATIYWGSKDFKFRNNTDYPIKISASTHDGKCHIALYGTDAKDYYVKMSYKVLSGPTGGGTEYVEFTSSNNPNGYRDGQVIQTAYSGWVIQTYKEKYSKETDALISTEKEAKSVFNSRPKIIAKLVGTTTEPTEPKPTEPNPTEPQVTEPPVTEPPVTQPPETQPPETQPPQTDPTTAP